MGIRHDENGNGGWREEAARRASDGSHVRSFNPQIIQLGDCVYVRFYVVNKAQHESKSTADPGKCYKISPIKSERGESEITK